MEARITLTIIYDETKFSTSPEHWDWDYLIGLASTTLRVNSVVEDRTANDLFTTSVIWTLIFGDPRLSLRTPESVHIHDHPIQRVRSFPLSVGKQLAELDPESNYFHIEFFPAKGIAEVWSAQAWKESLTRKLKHIQTDDSLVARRQKVHGELRFFFAQKTRCGADRASALADLLINFGNNNDHLLEMFEAPKALIESLNQLRKETNGSGPEVPPVSESGGQQSGRQDIQQTPGSCGDTGGAPQG